jgi:hypothetical protein
MGESPWEFESPALRIQSRIQREIVPTSNFSADTFMTKHLYGLVIEGLPLSAFRDGIRFSSSMIGLSGRRAGPSYYICKVIEGLPLSAIKRE